jgi:HAL2 family 3'(2'),5'-bisphosphate nucleotidase
VNWASILAKIPGNEVVISEIPPWDAPGELITRCEMSSFPGPFSREIEVAVRALRAAASLCERVQKRRVGGGTLEKSDRSPVTVADFGSQALVARELERAFPGDPLMGEEDAAELRDDANANVAAAVVAEVRESTGLSDRDTIFASIDRARSEGGRGRFWALDPIDGTKGFLRGEQYAVALALLDEGEVKVGALACPNLPHGGARGLLVVAARGAGAFRLWLSGDGAERVRVSPERDPARARLLESVEAAHGDHGAHDAIRARLRVAAPAVRLDSQAKYALLAQGEAEVYLRMPTSADYRENLWDHAAGALVVEEAGGRVSDVAGRPLDVTRGRKLVANRGVVATNGALHDAFLAAIAAAGGGGS